MYRAGIEGLLGLRKHGNALLIDPCVPRAWPGFTAVFRHGASHYDIVVNNPRGVSRGVSGVVVDGRALEAGGHAVQLVDDGARQGVTVTLGLPEV